MTTKTTPASYEAATKQSRTGRGASHDALGVLEEALSAPTPAREPSWRSEVIAALDTFTTALGSQADSDLGDQSLLSEIGTDQPRLLPRIERLHAEHRDLRESALSLRNQIAPSDGDAEAIDTANIRDRLSNIARQYRQHRARESDLVYEAINVDLGAGD